MHVPRGVCIGQNRPQPPLLHPQVFVEVIGGVYDVAFPPMKALADVLHPILDGAKTVIDTITCVRGAGEVG